MTDRVATFVLALPGWAVLVVVFALSALESSAFVGFVSPGEIALLLGGLLAQQGHLPLLAVLASGFTGAVLGDSVGYAVGRRYGRRLLHGVLGRFVKRDHLDRAEGLLAHRGGRAVFLGRFTAALRVMVPGAAGMARMPYPSFLVYNVAGAAGWVTLSVMLGYLSGSSWQHLAHSVPDRSRGARGVRADDPRRCVVAPLEEHVATLAATSSHLSMAESTGKLAPSVGPGATVPDQRRSCM